MRFAFGAAALLTLSFLGCGARTAILVADDLGDLAGASSGGAPSSAGANSGGLPSSAGTNGSPGGTHGGGTAGAGTGASAGSNASAGASAAGSAGSPSCQVTGPEQCDGLDNDCNGAVDDHVTCPCSQQAFEHRSYLFCLQVADWVGARDFCAQSGYHLTSIRDAAADRFLGQVTAGFANAHWWIGLNDRQQEGHFVWEAGTPVTYVKWGAGEPNNVGNEDCGELNRFGRNGGWNDEPCDGALPFVCESGGP